MSAIEYKVCTKCNIKKDVSHFRSSFKDKSKRKRYVSSHCKECEVKSKKEWRRKNGVKEKINRLTNNGKICSKCLVEKPLTDFPYKKTGRGNKNCYCYDCFYIIVRDCRMKNIINHRKWERAYVIKNKDKIKMIRKRIVEEMKDYYLVNKLVNKHGFSKMELKRNPVLIELYRNILKLKRKLWNRPLQKM